MQSFFPSSLIAYSWNYTLPHFAPRHFAVKCAVKNLRGIALMDGKMSSFSSEPVLQYTCPASSFRQDVVKIYRLFLFIPCVSLAWLACWVGKWGGGSSHTVQNGTNMGPGSQVLHREKSDMKPQGEKESMSPLSFFLSPHSFLLSSVCSWTLLIHSADAVTGWIASRLAVIPLKAKGAAMSQLWGDRALPLAGCHVGPVT